MHNSHHYIYHFLHNELNEIYISIAIRSVALSIINIFVPLLLLKFGYSLFTVLIFYGFMAILHASLVPFAAKLAERVGFKHIILLSVPFLIVYFLGVFGLQTFSYPIWILSIIGACHKALFWTGYHTNMARASKKGKSGSEVGIIGAISFAAGIIGPVMGGFLLSVTSFSVTFILVAVLLFVSAFPLFLTSEHKTPGKIIIRKVFKKRKFRHALGFLGVGFDSMAINIIWPIIIFLTITGNLTLIGVFASVSYLVAIIISVIVGRLSDKFPKQQVIRLGGFFNAGVWFIRGFVVTPLGVLVSDAVGSLTRTICHLPFNAYCYDIAKKEKHLASFILFREIMINIGAAAVMFILAFVWFSFKGTFTGMIGSLAIIAF